MRRQKSLIEELIEEHIRNYEYVDEMDFIKDVLIIARRAGTVKRAIDEIVFYSYAHKKVHQFAKEFLSDYCDRLTRVKKLLDDYTHSKRFNPIEESEMVNKLKTIISELLIRAKSKEAQDGLTQRIYNFMTDYLVR